MKRGTIIVTVGITILFLLSWVLKGWQYSATGENYVVNAFLITCSAFLTLAILSFLYQDNPIYKFAEHLYVGVSAGYWMCQEFWSTIVGNLIPRVSSGLSAYFNVPYIPGEWYKINGVTVFYSNWFFYIPIVFGFLLLMRLSSKAGWISRWALAFIVGTTAGYQFVRYLRSDFIEQISATFLPLLVDWQGTGHFFSHFSLAAEGQFVAMLSNWIILLGVLAGLVYFFFSKEHTGAFGRVSKVGIWVLMVTFGGSFGYAVMGRITLLVDRISWMFKDWLNLIH
jgi:hypothetical protein